MQEAMVPVVKQPPRQFKIGEVVKLHGHREVRIVGVQGRCAIVEHLQARATKAKPDVWSRQAIGLQKLARMVGG